MQKFFSMLTVNVMLHSNTIVKEIPPMFIFPRVRWKVHFIKDTPTDSIVKAHSSGWMTSETFLPG